MPWAVAGAAVIGAGASIYGSSQAAGAAQDAAKLQNAQQNAAVARAAPFVATGASAANQLAAYNSAGFNAGQPDYLSMAAAAVPDVNNMAGLVNTPGYQFTLQQGLQSTQNAAAARGLGVSGAALKGAASYATGLADNTYQQQFANQQTKMGDFLNLNTGQQANTTNLYNRLAGTATMGSNAASNLSTTGQQAAAAGGNYINQAGQATAAGTTGVANALTGGANSYMQMQALNALQQGGSIYGY